MTRLHLQFAPAFLNLSVAMLEQLEDQGFELCSGVYCGTPRFYNWLKSQPICESKRIDHIDLLEEQWVETPIDPLQLERIKTTYGERALHEAIIADRRVGAGFVAGARLNRSRLTDLVRKNEPSGTARYLVNLTAHMERLFDESKPDCVFFYAVAGAVAFVQHMIAAQRGLCILRLETTRFAEKYMLLSGSNTCSTVRSLMKRTSSDSHREAAEAIIRPIRESREIRHVALPFSLRSDIKNALRGIAKAANGLVMKKHDTPRSSRWHVGCNEIMKPVRRRLAHLKLKRLCRSNEKLLQGTFAFYPLHVNPEASTMVAGPYHTDQLAVIENLAKHLPLGLPLLVKEHAPMIGRRSPEFYDRLSAMPGVAMIAPSLKSDAIIQRASLVIVISGTAGWEAIVKGTPILALGDANWQAVDSGYVKAVPGALHDGIAQAMQTAPAKDDVIIQYIATLLEYSAALPLRLLWSSDSRSDTIAQHPSVTELCELLVRAWSDNGSLH